MHRYMLDDNYQKMCKDTLKQHTYYDDGLVNSLQDLFKDFKQTNVVMAQLLLNTFLCDLYLYVYACFNVHFLG